MKLMVVSNKFLISIMVIIAFLLIWRVNFSDNAIVGTILAVVVLLLMMFLYKADLNRLLYILKKNNTA